jgi:hypothetical protein
MVTIYNIIYQKDIHIIEQQSWNILLMKKILLMFGSSLVHKVDLSHLDW